MESHLSPFARLGLPPLVIKNLLVAGITEPKPIQEKGIPAFLSGKDLLGIAQTGSGKTLAFLLPILAQILPLGDKRLPKTARALILVPTRELALQIEETVKLIFKNSHLSSAVILGGASRLVQMKRMQAGVDILIATPGRLLDLIRESIVDLSRTQFLVLDEADRMLDMGFIQDIRKISSLIAPEHHTALFSATMPKEILSLAHRLLKDPLVIETAKESTTAPEIEQKLYAVPTREKKKFLVALLKNKALNCVIVFTRTKYGADGVARFLVKQGLAAAAIHGDKTQNARQRVLKDFRNGTLSILVATDIVARGIDIQGISHIINYDLPDEGESYVHRIGRTGRNGATGVAITLYDQSIENKRLHSIERTTRQKLKKDEIPEDIALLLQSKEFCAQSAAQAPRDKEAPKESNGSRMEKYKDRKHSKGNRRNDSGKKRSFSRKQRKFSKQ